MSSPCHRVSRSDPYLTFCVLTEPKPKSWRKQERHLLNQVQNPELALRLQAQLATTETVRGAHARVQQHAAQVLALHGPASQEPTFLGVDPVISTLGVSGWSAWLAGWPADAGRRAEQSLARARETGPPFALTFTLINAALVRMGRDELAAAQSLAQQLVALEARVWVLFVWHGGVRNPRLYRRAKPARERKRPSPSSAAG